MRIGLVGCQQAGKSTIASILSEKVICQIKLFKFADPLYEILDIYGQEKNRLFMQDESDVAKKYFGEDIYIDLMRERLNFFSSSSLYTMYLCDDCRYQKEFKLLKDYGFTMIGVDCPKEIRKQRAEQNGFEFNDNHSSEQFIEELIGDCDHIICNTSNDRKVLSQSVDEFLATI